MPGGRLRIILDALETFTLALLLALVVRAYLIESFVVSGDSMLPTLADGERVFVYRLAYALGRPERGDIIVFRYPLDPSRDFVKRIVGLPGDVIEVRSGRVFINGSFLSETYQVIKDRSSLPPTRVPGGDLFVLGDNRRVSEDSRYFGFVPLRNVKGEVFLVYWPPSRIAWVGALVGGP